MYLFDLFLAPAPTIPADPGQADYDAVVSYVTAARRYRRAATLRARVIAPVRVLRSIASDMAADLVAQPVPSAPRVVRTTPTVSADTIADEMFAYLQRNVRRGHPVYLVAREWGKTSGHGEDAANAAVKRLAGRGDLVRTGRGGSPWRLARRTNA